MSVPVTKKPNTLSKQLIEYPVNLEAMIIARMMGQNLSFNLVSITQYMFREKICIEVCEAEGHCDVENLDANSQDNYISKQNSTQI